MKVENIRLERTCYACPEQYDAYDENGNMVGYLRLRWGTFTVECPDAGGETVYEGEDVYGDGLFLDSERERFLNTAKEAIANYYNKEKCDDSTRKT